MDKKRKAQIYAFAILTYICILTVHYLMVCNRWLDNDIYFYLGLGKYIWNNKIIPSYHPYFIGGYLYNMIPQWLYNVAVYLINEATGYMGLFIFMLFWEILGAFYLYKIARLKKVDRILSILFIIMCFHMSTGIVTIRTNLMTFSLTIMQIYYLEKYKEKSEIKYLFIMPILSVFEMNAHMALWAIHLCIMAAYICPQIRLPIDMNKHTYRIKPLIYTAIIMFEAGILNPYGARGYFFVKDGISNDSLEIIEEMKPLTILSAEGLAIIFCTAILFYAIIRKKTSYEYFYIFLGLVFLSVNQSRNMHWGYLGIIILAFDLLKNTDFTARYDVFVPKKIIAFSPFLLLFGFAILAHCTENLGINTNKGFEQMLDNVIAEMERDPDPDKNVFNESNLGGYLEWKGYNIFIDNRMDGCMPGFTGGIDLLNDYKRLYYTAGPNEIEAILNKYDFKYALTGKSTRLALYLQMSDDYELVCTENSYDPRYSLSWSVELYKKK